MSINKGERAELRSIVKQQFRVLRAEVAQREAELLASVQDEITEKFSTEDKAWADVQHVIHESLMEANRRINDALYEGGFQERGSHEQMWLANPRMSQPRQVRMDLQRVASARLHAQVHAALLALDRQEADLLRTLSVGALESDEAQAFLSAIPTVSELVPAARLAELERAMGDGA